MAAIANSWLRAVVDRQMLGDVGQCSVGQTGVVDESHRRLHEVTGGLAVCLRRDEPIGQRRLGGRFGPRLVEPPELPVGVARDLCDQGSGHERRIDAGQPEPGKELQEDCAVGGPAEMRKHDVDEVVDDLVLVSASAQGDEGTVGRLGITVAQGFGESIERSFVKFAIAGCFDGCTGRRPGGGDAGDALSCGLPLLRRDHGEQSCSCHEFQRGVKGERVGRFVARD